MAAMWWGVMVCCEGKGRMERKKTLFSNVNFPATKCCLQDVANAKVTEALGV